MLNSGFLSVFCHYALALELTDYVLSSHPKEESKIILGCTAFFPGYMR